MIFLNEIFFHRKEHGGCFDQLSAISGLTFCGEVSIPMEGFKILSPSYGPSKASIRLEKDDESLTAYHFKAFYNNKRKLSYFDNFGDSYYSSNF